MKKLIIFLPLFLFPFLSHSQDICSDGDGLCVIQFNASFNSANGVDWCDDLTDCSTSDVDIMTQSDLQKKHKIVVVPTILVFEDGEEVARFQANIMMEMEVTRDEVQEVVDEILMNKF